MTRDEFIEFALSMSGDEWRRAAATIRWLRAGRDASLPPELVPAKEVIFDIEWGTTSRAITRARRKLRRREAALERQKKILSRRAYMRNYMARRRAEQKA